MRARSLRARPHVIHPGGGVRLVQDGESVSFSSDDENHWPRGARGALLAMESVCRTHKNRRILERVRYRRTARVSVNDIKHGKSEAAVYVRDATPWTLGFVTGRRLSLGLHGNVTLAMPNGSVRSVPCTIYRCREVMPGWHEGVLQFDYQQPILCERGVFRIYKSG